MSSGVQDFKALTLPRSERVRVLVDAGRFGIAAPLGSILGRVPDPLPLPLSGSGL